MFQVFFPYFKGQPVKNLPDINYSLFILYFYENYYTKSPLACPVNVDAVERRFEFMACPEFENLEASF
jgi:hypothetical protein